MFSKRQCTYIWCVVEGKLFTYACTMYMHEAVNHVQDMATTDVEGNGKGRVAKHVNMLIIEAMKCVYWIRLDLK
jgi:hypothetical protein